MLSRLQSVLTILTLGLVLSLPAADGYGPDFTQPDIPDDTPITIDKPTLPPSSDRPMLGVQMSPPSRRVIEDEGLDAHTGVYVHRVYDDTAAADLGIQRGDVVTAINGRPISSMTDLREIVLGSQVGDQVDVVVRRDGQDVALVGGSYQTWPDAIPYRDLDPAAEERYRQLQQRRLDDQLRRMDRLAEETEALQQQLDAMQDGSAMADALGLDDVLGDAALPRLADGSLPELLPAALLAIPGWRFSYGFGVDDAADLVVDPAELDAAPALDLPTDAPTGTRLLATSFDISSEYL